MLQNTSRPLRIAYCGPISLQLLEDFFPDTPKLPQGYSYALGAFLVRELLRQGYSVSVVTCAFDVKLRKALKAGNLELRIVPRRRPKHFVWDCYKKERRAMLRELQDCQPDIVHAHWTYEFAHVAIDSGLPYVVTVRDYPPAILAHTLQLYRLYRLLYSFYIIPRCHVLVANSPYLARKIEQTYRKPVRSVIPNGIASDFKERKSYAAAKEETFNVTIVANWDRRKNVANALRAFALAHQELPQLRLHLFGHGLGGNEKGALFAAAKGLTEGLHFHGYQSPRSIQQFHLEHTDVLLHPSLEESFGMTLLEAMALGIPAIGGQKAGAVPWVIGEGGVLVDVRKPEAMADAMVDLAKHREKLIDFGNKALERAKMKFSMRSSAEAYAQLYHEVCSENNC